MKGGVPIGHGDYYLRQMTVIFKRAPTGEPSGAEEVASTPQKDESKAEEDGDCPVPDAAEGAVTEAQAAAAARVEEREAREAAEACKKARSKLPEIILLWARSMRRGGNLVVCPNEQSMNRLIRAYLVCEVVQDSQLFDKSM